jgi:hypothetical protein
MDRRVLLENELLVAVAQKRTLKWFGSEGWKSNVRSLAGVGKWVYGSKRGKKSCSGSIADKQNMRCQ